MVNLTRPPIIGLTLKTISPAIFLTALLAACQAAMPAATPSTSGGAVEPIPCVAASAPPGAEIVVSGQVAPDDLAFDARGRLLFSDIHDGTISRWSAGAGIERLASGLQVPEGLAILPEGRILVAEQGRNRIVRVDPEAHTVSPWRSFPNHTVHEGIDGIVLDPVTGDVIVPDSPNGVVWRVTPDGSMSHLLGSGMVRPVGAAVDSTGRVMVADEGGALWVLVKSEPPRRIASLPTPDDVVVDRTGHVLVNTLRDGAVHEIDAEGADTVIISHLRGPQGIAVDGAENIYYTESDAGRIGRLVRTFALGTPNVVHTERGTYVVCTSIERAAGFTGPLQIDLATSTAAAVVQVVQPNLDSPGFLELRAETSAHNPSVDIVVQSGGLRLIEPVTLPT